MMINTNIFSYVITIVYFLNSAIESEKHNIQTSFPVGAVCLCDNILSSIATDLNEICLSWPKGSPLYKCVAL